MVRVLGAFRVKIGNREYFGLKVGIKGVDFGMSAA